MINSTIRYAALGIITLFTFLIIPFSSTNAGTSNPYEGISRFIGDNDSVLIASPNGEILFSKNADKKLIPASTLKVLTALVAIHTLGKNYRFPTEFYLDDDSNLKIKGYGDPLLISESLEKIAEALKNRVWTINDIVLDDSYFKKPADIPGTADDSIQPYDAPNGALCVNFNTVYFKYENGKYISAEPQTPLLPIAIKHIRASGLSSGRILLSKNNDEIIAYAGGLFEFFFKQAGIRIRGKTRPGRVYQNKDRLVYRHFSGLELTRVVSSLLEYSNNFIANQLLLSAGAGAFGPPATLEKGIRAAEIYADTALGIKNLFLVEGSGISRKNRVSARMFLKILNAFSPYHDLMRHEGNEYYKTGTLDGINTRVGFIQSKTGGLYRFVVLLNTPGKRTDPVMRIVRRAVTKTIP